MVRGKVVFFNDDGGYGFIEVEDDDDHGLDDDEDVYFHMADVGGPDLEEGQAVDFEIEDADKGPRARDVERVDAEE